MRLMRILIPLAGAIVVAGIVLVLAVALRKTPAAPTGSATTRSADYADLLELKARAEALAIEGKLAESHATYRELFARAQGRDLKTPDAWDLLERAKFGQDRVFVMLLEKQDSGTTTAPVTTRAAVTAPATRAVATSSFVDAHPPYHNLATRPATTQTARPATVPLVAASQPAATQPTRFQVTRTLRDNSGFSDQMIGLSLTMGSEFLIVQFKNGEIQQGREISEAYRHGLNALCVYALLSSGQATRDPRLAITSPFMRELIERMKQHPMATDKSAPQQPLVYARSLRAAALAVHDRPEDRKQLKEDVEWLIAAAVNGAYSYDDRGAVNVIPADPKDVPKPDKPEKEPKKFHRFDPNSPMKSQGIPAGGLADALSIMPIGSDVPIILVDGLHDPRTGRELGPYPFPLRKYPKPSPAPDYPPQMLPEKYEGPFTWDNSNSQYGVMGVWAGAQRGIEVPEAYWAAVRNHWLGCQLAGGEWPYRKDRPVGYQAMNCAGVASLMVVNDALEAPSVSKVGRQASAADKALAAGLDWLETADNAINVGGLRTVYLGYTLHTLGRVGLESGFKYLGAHDWYRALAKKIVLSQWENGSWGRGDQSTADTLIDTSYTLLFLARGRHPVMMNKLRLDPPAGRPVNPLEMVNTWNNRPRDLAGLTRFASRELERPVNWQIVPLGKEAGDWSDAPVLYFASHQALSFTDAEVKKLRAFADGGGMLLTQADNNAESFNLFVQQLAKRVFPEGEMKDLPAEHEVYGVQYVIARNSRPRLRGVSNGSRLVWIHSPTDLALSWQQRAEKSKREAFEMGANLFVYAGGKTDLRNRLDDRAIPMLATMPSRVVTVARLKYGGNWDPEPGAWPRFANYLHWETSLGVNPAPVEVGRIGESRNVPIAHLTGTAAYVPGDAEIASLKAYVENGGTLIVETTGPADAAFADSLQASILPRAFAGARFEAVGADHPLLHAGMTGMEDVWPPRLRASVIAKIGNDAKAIPPLRMARVGKGRVIYLPLDCTTGMLGCNAWPVFGYEPAEALAVMKNLVLWVLENP